MLTQLRRIPLVIALTGLIAAFAAPATAGTIWEVTPGGTATGPGPATIKDAAAGAELTCTITMTIQFRSGPATHLGKITSVAFAGCTGPGGLRITFTPEALPWWLNAISYNPKSGVTTGTITGIKVAFNAAACAGTVDGTSPTGGNGRVAVTFTNSLSELKVLPTGGDLHTYNVKGCFGFIANGDPIDISATVTVKPAQVIRPA